MLGVAPADEERDQAADQRVECRAPPEHRSGWPGPLSVHHVAWVVTWLPASAMAASMSSQASAQLTSPPWLTSSAPEKRRSKLASAPEEADVAVGENGPAA